jgi:hypothetical protein
VGEKSGLCQGCFGFSSIFPIQGIGPESGKVLRPELPFAFAEDSAGFSSSSHEGGIELGRRVNILSARLRAHEAFSHSGDH